MAGVEDDLLISINVILLACSLILRRRRALKARRRRFWVRPSWRFRNTEGQARALLPRLRARDEGYFRDFLRMPPSTFDTLLGLVGPKIERKVTPFREPISPHDRLAITLRFLANGDTFRSLSYNFLIGRSTAAVIIRQTTAAIWESLQPLYLRFPQCAREWKKIAADMELHWNFPNCIGSIDGKHINIECPDNTGLRNLNYKKTFSVVLLASCDAHYRFTYVDLCHYGGESDGGIFLRSPLRTVLTESQCGIPPPSSVGSAGAVPYLMVGDEAFPLKTFLMRPYPRRGNDPAQYQEYLKRATFNYRLSRTRRLIENSFGIMANRWRILRRAFKASEEITESVVKACVTLHNFLLKDSAHSRSAYSPPGYTDHEDWEGKLIDGQWKNDTSGQPGLRDLAGVGLRPARTALAVRDQLASYFMNDGKVEWQDKIVSRAGCQQVFYPV
ncbi:unnamed protein product [Ixodes pacificus]